MTSQDIFSDKKVKLKSNLDSSRTGIIVLDQQGVINKINKTAVQFFGTDTKKLIGRDFRSIISPQHISDFDKWFNQPRDTGEHGTLRMEMKMDPFAAAQTRYEADLELMEPVIDQQRLYIVLLRDQSRWQSRADEVEKQRELKREIARKLKKEKELSELKSRFVSMASHEFRTPLARVLSSLQLIKRYLRAEGLHWSEWGNQKKVEAHFEKIEESVKQLTLILNDFLSLGKLKEGKIKCMYTRFDVEDHLSSICHELQPLCKPGQKIHYSHTSEEKKVFLDKHLLRNIINNLITNSIKYSAEGKEIHLMSGITASGITIVVQDHGMGIPLHEQENIFIRFFRAENALNYPGTGLGLNLVKQYAEIMQGDVRFESRENEGTTFFVTFPRYDANGKD